MLALSLGCGINFSCATAKKPPEKNSTSESNNNELNLLEENTTDQDIGDDEAIDPQSALVHPKEATYEATRAIVLAARQPQSAEIQECRSQVEAAAKEAANEDEIGRAARKISVYARRQFRVYHWCFYQLFVNVDDTMRSTNVGFEAQSEKFVTRMKMFLPFARSLDQVDGSNSYTQYLRQRYLELSQRFFGRNLQPIENFLEKKPSQEKHERGKPADIFDDY